MCSRSANRALTSRRIRRSEVDFDCFAIIANKHLFDDGAAGRNADESGKLEASFSFPVVEQQGEVSMRNVAGGNKTLSQQRVIISYNTHATSSCLRIYPTIPNACRCGFRVTAPTPPPQGPPPAAAAAAAAEAPSTPPVELLFPRMH